MEKFGPEIRKEVQKSGDCCHSRATIFRFLDTSEELGPLKREMESLSGGGDLSEVLDTL
jgi:hypothetical protein